MAQISSGGPFGQGLISRFPQPRLRAGARFSVELTPRIRRRVSAKRRSFCRGVAADHSSRNASIGFVLVARSAGSNIATIDDETSNRETPQKASGSCMFKTNGAFFINFASA